MNLKNLLKKKIHFVGIGGIGMSGLARILLARGCRVSGSDVKRSSLIDRLQKEGAEIAIGHRKENIRDADVLVYSSCIPSENPERIEGGERRLEILSRGELLSRLFQEKKVRIAVSGSHGKTTTTAMTAYLLEQAGCHPVFLIGGISRNLGVNGGDGEGDYFVAEADESDGSFLALSPTLSVVTNMDAEHLDYYKTHERSLEAYAAFLEHTEQKGKVFVSSDCPHTAGILKKLRHPHPVTFGFSPDADIRPDRITKGQGTLQFDVFRRGTKLGTFRLHLSGRHNIANALGVIAVGMECGIPLSAIQQGLEDFRGVERRLDVREFPSLTIVEDYAHHPTEIKATLAAVRDLVNGRRVVGVFQPHRYSRTQLLAKEFGRCFGDLNILLMTEIYASSEEPIPDVDAETLLREVRQVEKGKEVRFVPKQKILSHLSGLLRPEDVLVVLGAGDINEVARELAVQCSQGHLPWMNKPEGTL
ncbi:MAG: UDP-N-acetylmuramate--L-alanine ligase [Candidatus Omnitrophota bacterium]